MDSISFSTYQEFPVTTLFTFCCLAKTSKDLPTMFTSLQVKLVQVTVIQRLRMQRLLNSLQVSLISFSCNLPTFTTTYLQMANKTTSLKLQLLTRTTQPGQVQSRFLTFRIGSQYTELTLLVCVRTTSTALTAVSSQLTELVFTHFQLK